MSCLSEREIMARYAKRLEEESKDGVLYYLECIPAKKKHGTMTMGNRTYECITWTENGEDV